jgi:hypothetical protein
MSQKLVITCPECKKEFALDETLAGPMIARIKSEAEDQVRMAQKEVAAKELLTQQKDAELASKEKILAEREASIQTQVNQALAFERLKIVEQERQNLRAELAPEIEAERKKTATLQAKLTESQKNELELRAEKDAIEEQRKNLQLEIARGIDAGRAAIRDQAKKDADEANKLRFAEKDKIIEGMREKLAEAERKATQGSQQLQGDVLELDFEAALRQAFPQDLIEPVKAGVSGGDVLQRVLGNMGRPVGTVLWETKRAQNWGGNWCAKAKQDASEAKAEVAVIVSEVVPSSIGDFGEHEGVWIVRPNFAVPLSAVVRRGVIETAEARSSATGRETKKDLLYNYMTGPEFRAMLMGIAEPFREMHEELQSEKRSTLTRWKRQEKRIDRVLTSVAGLQGDLQGIAGSEIQALPKFAVNLNEEEEV